MDTHKCQFAELIGQSPEWQTDPDGLTVCKYCHAPKTKMMVGSYPKPVGTSTVDLAEPVAKPATKTVRK